MADALAKLRGRAGKTAMASLPTSRNCDGCDMCCTAIPIHQMNKPGGVACKHLSGEPGLSCSIYERRPPVCSTFACVWRGSDWHLPDWAKPALIGWVLTINDPYTWPLVVTVHCDPARPDSWRDLWSQTILTTIADNWNCMVAIESAPNCKAVIAPTGQMLTRDTMPELFEDVYVGLPDFLFHPDRTLPAMVIVATRFDWSRLVRPPWAKAAA